MPYRGAFERREGDRGTFSSDELMQLDNSITITKLSARDVETESSVDNCSLTLKQTITDRAPVRALADEG